MMRIGDGFRGKSQANPHTSRLVKMGRAVKIVLKTSLLVFDTSWQLIVSGTCVNKTK